jgi:hypothetical protein
MQLAMVPWATSARTSAGAVPDTCAFATSPRHSCKASSPAGPFGPMKDGFGGSAQLTSSGPATANSGNRMIGRIWRIAPFPWPSVSRKAPTVSSLLQRVHPGACAVDLVGRAGSPAVMLAGSPLVSVVAGAGENCRASVHRAMSDLAPALRCTRAANTETIAQHHSGNRNGLPALRCSATTQDPGLAPALLWVNYFKKPPRPNLPNSWAHAARVRDSLAPPHTYGRNDPQDQRDMEHSGRPSGPALPGRKRCLIPGALPNEAQRSRITRSRLHPQATDAIEPAATAI